MGRSLLNWIVDTAAALLLLGMVATGWILRFPLPPGTHRTHDLWGISRHDWGALHSWISIGLLVVVSVHLVLHWRWIVSSTLKWISAGSAAAAPARAGRLAAAVLVGAWLLFAWLVQTGVRPLPEPRHELPGEQAPAGPAPRRSHHVAGEGSTSGTAPSTLSARRAAGPAGSTSDVASEAARVLAERCAACHGDERPAGGVQADTTSRLLETGRRWITPGRPDASALFDAIGVPSPGRPLAAAHRIDGCELEVLGRWVASLPAPAQEAAPGL